MKQFALVFLLALLAGAAPALSESLPKSVAADARIRVVPFQENNVVYLSGMLGVSTMVVFNEDEKVATIAMGDTVAWQAVPDQSKRFIFIKPLEANAVTNMNVITSRRVYNFILRGLPPGNTRDASFKVVFSYPEDKVTAAQLAQAKANASMPNLQAALSHLELLNYDYGYKGSAENKPVSVVDDGTKTFFQFSGEIPAIFAVKSDGSETLINYRREGDRIVVDKISPQWTLRQGSVTTCIFNRRAIAGQTGTPQPAANSFADASTAQSQPVIGSAPPAMVARAPVVANHRQGG